MACRRSSAIVHAHVRAIFTFLQRPSGYARELVMTPHKLIRIQVGRIAGQEVLCKTTHGTGHIFLCHRLLVCWQSIAFRLRLPGDARKGARFQLSIASESPCWEHCDGFCVVRLSSPSRLPTEFTIRLMLNFLKISSRTMFRVHKVKSNMEVYHAQGQFRRQE